MVSCSISFAWRKSVYCCIWASKEYSGNSWHGWKVSRHIDVTFDVFWFFSLAIEYFELLYFLFYCTSLDSYNYLMELTSNKCPGAVGGWELCGTSCIFFRFLYLVQSSYYETCPLSWKAEVIDCFVLFMIPPSHWLTIIFSTSDIRLNKITLALWGVPTSSLSI